MHTLRIMLTILLLVLGQPASAWACVTCGEALNGGDPSDLCETSGALYDALTACLCETSCSVQCGDNACQSLPMSDPCLNCLDTSCGNQKADCLSDALPGPCPGQIDCGNGTCCPAEAEACGDNATCVYPCPDGQERCGGSFCITAGNVCCDYVGHPELSCSGNHVCTDDGGCKLDTTSCGGGCGHNRDASLLPLLLAAPWLRRRIRRA